MERRQLKNTVNLVVDLQRHNQQHARISLTQARCNLDVLLRHLVEIDGVLLVSGAANQTFRQFYTLLAELFTAVCKVRDKVEVRIVLNLIVQNEETALNGTNIFAQLADYLESQLVDIVVVVT